MNEVHLPDLVVLRRMGAILPQLRLELSPRRLAADLQTQLLVEAIDPLGVHAPSLSAQQHVNATVAVAHPRYRDPLNPGYQGSLIAAL